MTAFTLSDATTVHKTSTTTIVVNVKANLVIYQDGGLFLSAGVCAFRGEGAQTVHEVKGLP